MFRFAMIAAALLLSASQALAHGDESAPPPPKKGPAAAPASVVFTPKGPVLTDLKGMTLYYFDKDDSGNKSTCNGKCTERWIPLTAPADAEAFGDFTVIIRNDGSRMWAYRYRPLYTSPRDKAPGEANGYDASSPNYWHIARPAL
jgi:predicted lipoprotein with Yx(FWY)xxD motif